MADEALATYPVGIPPQRDSSMLKTLTATATLLAALAPAHAVSVLYTNEAAYLAAVGATSTYIDFTGASGSVAGNSFSANVTFGSCDDAVSSCIPNVLHSSNAITDLGSSTRANGVGLLAAQFAAPTSAFAFHYISGGMGSVILSNGDTVNVNSTLSGFVGIVTTVPVLTIRAVNNMFTPTTADRYFFDDFRINAAVPEPSAWALFAASAGLLGAAARRRRKGTDQTT
jgi:PEP-CTERM motif